MRSECGAMINGVQAIAVPPVRGPGAERGRRACTVIGWRVIDVAHEPVARR